MTTETMEAPASEVLDAPKLSAVKVYNPIEQGIALMLEKHGAVLLAAPDVSTEKAMASAKANRTEMVKFRTSIEAARKAEKEESLVYGRLVDSEAKRITAIAAPIEKAYHDAITAEEQRLENVRLAALELERQRIAGHKARIQIIKDVRETANMCRTADRVKQLIDGMPALIEKPFEEFQDEAMAAFNDICTVLTQLHEVKAAQELQAAELARQKQELAIQQAELQRQEQEAAARRAAEQAEVDRKAGIRAKLDVMRELRLQGGLAKTSAEVEALLARLVKPDDSFAEFALEASDLYLAVAGDLRDLSDAKFTAETNAAAVADQAARAAAKDAEALRQVEAVATPDLKTTTHCCEKGARIGVEICPDCVDASGAYQSDMGVTAAQQETVPALKLGVISERIAPLSITADGLRMMGFAHAKIAGNSKLYHEADFPAICDALIAHVAAVKDQFTTVAV